MRPHENIKGDPKYPLLRAILTDPHFWLPIAVLILGVGILMVMR